MLRFCDEFTELQVNHRVQNQTRTKVFCCHFSLISRPTYIQTLYPWSKKNTAQYNDGLSHLISVSTLPCVRYRKTLCTRLWVYIVIANAVISRQRSQLHVAGVISYTLNSSSVQWRRALKMSCGSGKKLQICNRCNYGCWHFQICLKISRNQILYFWKNIFQQKHNFPTRKKTIL